MTLHRSRPPEDRTARRGTSSIGRLLRVLGAALAALLVGAVILLPAGPASAAEADLGWLRLDPPSAKTADVTSILTEKPCPAKANAVVVTLEGPNIPEGNSIGNIVGVTQLKALKPTISGQLLVPLSFTFRDWFAVNAVQVKPGGTYTLTATCRDLLRASQTFGAFTGAVVLDGKGGFRAVGDAAKPFNTELKPLDPADPLAGSGLDPTAAPTSEPSAQGDPSAAPGATEPAEPGDDAAPASSEEPAAGVATTASGERPPTDTTARNVLLGIGAVLLVGLAFAGALRRPLRREDEPVGQRERVDAL